MSRALGLVLLRMFSGHGAFKEQDLREQPEQEPPAPVLARPAKPAAQARGRTSSSHSAAISWRLVIS